MAFKNQLSKHLLKLITVSLVKVKFGS